MVGLHLCFHCCQHQWSCTNATAVIVEENLDAVARGGAGSVGGTLPSESLAQHRARGY